MDIENVVQIDVEPSVDTSGKIAFEIEKTGPQGLSAYDVAVKDGFEGTEQEWLVSLKGDIGETPEIAIGTTQTLPAGSNAVVTKAGTTENPVFSFGIPRGVQGATGATPNLQVGSVTSGDEPEVTITGTVEQPILNFVLEKGEKGSTGSTGEDGFSPIASVTKSAGITTLTITDKTGTTTTTINDGEKGADGQDGAIQYTAGNNITIENNVISATGGDLSNYLAKDNTTSYTPSGDYNPATKIYVDSNKGADIPIYMLETKRSIWDAATNITSSNDATALTRASEIINTMYNSSRKYGGILFYSTNTKYNFLMLLKDEIATSKTQFYFYTNASAYQMTYSNRMLVYRYLKINGSWSNGVFTCSSMNYDVGGDYNFDLFNTTNTAQTISAKKTYNILPESSITPTTNNQLVNKKYVDDAISSAITDALNGSY